MKRPALLTLLLAGAGLSALALGCSGPTPPPGDAGFSPTATWGTGGAYYGTGGSYGTGGAYSGSGGAFGGGGGQRLDAGEEQEPPGGGNPGGGNPGGGGPNRRRDAGVRLDATSAGPDATFAGPDATSMPGCPADAMSGAMCMTGGTTCRIPAGDGGRGAICECRERRGEGTWRCYNP